MGVSTDKQAQVSALSLDRNGALWCLITDQSGLSPTGSGDRLLAKSATRCNRLSADLGRAAKLALPSLAPQGGHGRLPQIHLNADLAFKNPDISDAEHAP